MPLCLWLKIVGHIVEIAILPSQLIISIVLIFILAIAPVYFYHEMPSSIQLVMDISRIKVFGIISLAQIIVMVNALWIYLLTFLIFQFINKITCNEAALITFLFYFPFLPVLIVLLLPEHYLEIYAVKYFNNVMR